jgi:hypothetical protein
MNGTNFELKKLVLMQLSNSEGDDGLLRFAVCTVVLNFYKIIVAFHSLVLDSYIYGACAIVLTAPSLISPVLISPLKP